MHLYPCSIFSSIRPSFDDISKSLSVCALHRFNAKRKFRGAAKAVILMHRLKGSSMSGKLDDSTGDGEGMDESGPPVDFKPVRDNILATNVVATA